METTTEIMNILSTTEYGSFRTLKGNRSLDLSHVEKLKDSMRNNFLIKPIDVNEHLEVIDGQHRLEACKYLELPVYYIIQKGWGIEEAQALNIRQKNWTTQDYLNGYCELGFDEYIKFNELVKKYEVLPFSIVFACALLRKNRPNGRVIVKFKNGNFEFINYEKTEKLLNDICRIKEFYPGYNKSSFCLAMFRSLCVEGFIFESFLEKLKFRSSDMANCTSIEKFLPVIESIYNYRRRSAEKIRLY